MITVPGNFRAFVSRAVALLSFTLLAQADDTASPWLEGAKNEGKVVLYTSFSLADLQNLASPFSKMYPEVRLEVVREGSSTLIPKILAEHRAKRPLADLIFTKADYLGHTSGQGASTEV